MKAVLLLIVLTCSINAYGGTNSFMKRGYEGWFWYEDKQKQLEEELLVYPEGIKTPTQRKKYVQKLYEETLDAAYDNPTPANIIKHLKVERHALKKSAKFAKARTRVMQTHPELSEVHKYPISKTGKEIWKTKQKQAKHARIKAASLKYGLFYFYKGSCDYCKSFIPVLNDFKDKYGFEMIAITLDGVILPELKDTKQNASIAQKLQVKHVPALYLIDTQTNQAMPIAFGITDFDTLEENANAVLEYKQDKDDEN